MEVGRALFYLNSANSFPIPGIDINFFEVVKSIYNSNGLSVETVPEWRNVLAYRNFTPVSNANPRGLFDDIILVTWSSNEGKSLNWEGFAANTDPSYQYSEEGSPIYRGGRRPEGLDANRDGKKDLGMLPLGIYKYKAYTETHIILGDVFKPLESVRVHRDINRDGYFTNEDEKLVKDESQMYEGGTMYIHRGYDIRDKKKPLNTWSAGCQTMEFNVFERFRKNIAVGRKNGQSSFTYLLISSDKSTVR